MKEWQERVIVEKEELLKKIGSLDVVICNDKNDVWIGLDAENRMLLCNQYYLMVAYANVLKKRIDLWSKE